MKKSTLTIILVSIITVIAIGSILTTIYIINSSSNVGPDKSQAAVQDSSSVILSFDQTSVSVQAGNSFTTKVRVTPSDTFPIQGYKFKLNFDKASLELTDMKYLLGTYSNDLSDHGDDPNTTENESTLADANSRGSAIVWGEAQGSNPNLITGNATDVVSLTFKILSVTNSSIDLDTTNTTYSPTFTALTSAGDFLKVPATLAAPLVIGASTVTTVPATAEPTFVPVTTAATTTNAPAQTTSTSQTTTVPNTTTAVTTTSAIGGSGSTETVTVTTASDGSGLGDGTTVTTEVPTTTVELPNTGIMEDTMLTIVIAVLLLISGAVVYKVKSKNA